MLASLTTNVITNSDIPSTSGAILIKRSIGVGFNPVQIAQNHVRKMYSSVTSKSKRLIDIAGTLVGLAITGIVAVPVAIAV